MGRKRKPFTRKTGNKDAPLFVIACEGYKTEPCYLQDYNQWYLATNPAVHIEILDKADPGHSSPEQLLEDLDKFRNTYKLKRNDQLWLVMDRDYQSWDNKMLDDIARKCRQKEIGLALSNPCFEIWLIFHREDPYDYNSSFQQELLRNPRETRNKTKVQKHLEDLIGQYNPANLNSDDFLPHIHYAIETAKSHDKPEERWPNHLGSRVYKLIEALQTFRK